MLIQVRSIRKDVFNYVKREISIKRLQILQTKLNVERHFFIFLKKVLMQNESGMTYLYVLIENQDTEIIREILREVERVD